MGRTKNKDAGFHALKFLNWGYVRDSRRPAI